MSAEKPSKPAILRADPRHPVTWKASIRCADWQAVERVAVINLSKGGMFVRTDHPPALGTPVEVVLVLPDGREERLQGIVRHHGGAGSPGSMAGVGVEIDPACRNLMGALAEIARIERGLPSTAAQEPPKPATRAWPKGRAASRLASPTRRAGPWT